MSKLGVARFDAASFEALVAARGGRVDFLFGDERPFAQCHASTLAEAADGALLCAWFGGTREKDPDVGIWLGRFDGSWSAPRQVAKIEETAHWNPVLFRGPDETLVLFFKVGADTPHWRTYAIQSADGGHTWSEPRELVPGDVGGRGPVRNKPIVLADGAWLAPASTERDDDRPGSWKAFADRSEDGGRTWERSDDFSVDEGLIAGDGIIQPTLWESAPGRVHALVRSSGGIIGRTDSMDGGRTWSAVYASGLPNNNSGIDALRLEDGRVLLVYNPIGEDWGPRTPLNLAVSDDNGATWMDVAHLEDDGVRFSGYDRLIAGDATQAAAATGEYSYPAIVGTREGVAISYTWRRERIRCWQVPLACL